MGGQKRRTRTRGKSIAEPALPKYAIAKARVFQSGNSQAIRLPKQFRLKGKEVEIFRRGDDIVLREAPAKLSRALDALPPLPDNALPDDIPDRSAEPLSRL
jgi:antitoxin VapB